MNSNKNLYQAYGITDIEDAVKESRIAKEIRLKIEQRQNDAMKNAAIEMSPDSRGRFAKMLSEYGFGKVAEDISNLR